MIQKYGLLLIVLGTIIIAILVQNIKPEVIRPMEPIPLDSFVRMSRSNNYIKIKSTGRINISDNSWNLNSDKNLMVIKNYGHSMEISLLDSLVSTRLSDSLMEIRLSEKLIGIAAVSKHNDELKYMAELDKDKISLWSIESSSLFLREVDNELNKLDSSKLKSLILDQINTREANLITLGITRKDIEEIHKEHSKSKIKELLNQYPDFHQSILQVCFPQKPKKWETYEVKGDLQKIIESKWSKIDVSYLTHKKGGYTTTTKKDILVPNMVRLKLNGSKFHIKQISEDWQSLETIFSCKWVWEVIPIERESDANLYFALEGKNDAGQVFTITTFTETVSISGGYGKDLAKNWQWIVGAIIVPLTGWLVLADGSSCGRI